MCRCRTQPRHLIRVVINTNANTYNNLKNELMQWSHVCGVVLVSGFRHPDTPSIRSIGAT